MYNTRIEYTYRQLNQIDYSPADQQTSSSLHQQTSSPTDQKISSPAAQQSSSPVDQQSGRPAAQQTSSPVPRSMRELPNACRVLFNKMMACPVQSFWYWFSLLLCFSRRFMVFACHLNGVLASSSPVTSLTMRRHYRLW